jgi:hypothetical protein
MTDPFNPKRLTLTNAPRNAAPKTGKPPRHRPGQKFLKGPVPWGWITLAAQRPGRALHVAVALWFMAGIKRERTLKVPQKVLRELGMDRFAFYRALDALELAGLVAAVRRNGCSPVVTILEAPERG